MGFILQHKALFIILLGFLSMGYLYNKSLKENAS